MKKMIIATLIFSLFASSPMLADSRNVMTKELLGIDQVKVGGVSSEEALIAYASKPGFLEDLTLRVTEVGEWEEGLPESPAEFARAVRDGILAGHAEKWDLKGETLSVVTARRSSGKIYSWDDVSEPASSETRHSSSYCGAIRCAHHI